MTSDPGVICQNSDYAMQIQEALDEFQQMQEAPRVVTNPEDLDALERELRQRTDRLSSLLLGLHLQHSLDCECSGQVKTDSQLSTTALFS